MASIERCQRVILEPMYGEGKSITQLLNEWWSDNPDLREHIEDHEWWHQSFENDAPGGDCPEGANRDALIAAVQLKITLDIWVWLF